jgi:hypothetical protein
MLFFDDDEDKQYKLPLEDNSNWKDGVGGFFITMFVLGLLAGMYYNLPKIDWTIFN